MRNQIWDSELCKDGTDSHVPITRVHPCQRCLVKLRSGQVLALDNCKIFQCQWFMNLSQYFQICQPLSFANLKVVLKYLCIYLGDDLDGRQKEHLHFLSVCDRRIHSTQIAMHSSPTNSLIWMYADSPICMKFKLLVNRHSKLGQQEAKKAEDAVCRSTEASNNLALCIGFWGKKHNQYNSLNTAVREVLASFGKCYSGRQSHIQCLFFLNSNIFDIQHCINLICIIY